MTLGHNHESLFLQISELFHRDWRFWLEESWNPGNRSYRYKSELWRNAIPNKGLLEEKHRLSSNREKLWAFELVPAYSAF